MSEAVPARYEALVIAGAELGLRPGELLGLAADRVDFLRRTVRVDQQIAQGPAAASVWPRSRPGVLPDGPPCRRRREGARRPHHRGAAASDPGVIFTTRGGGPVQQHPWAEVWGRADQDQAPGVGHAP